LVSAGKAAAEYARRLKADTRDRREQHKGRKVKQPALSLAEARANRYTCDWSAYRPPVPNSSGVRMFENIPLEELVRFIDWMPFFQCLEFAASFPTC
jgi:5-methyltetrahydrofolate--homocysteine methyltransferase